MVTAIKDLPETLTELDDDDVLVADDVSASETKKVPFSALASSVGGRLGGATATTMSFDDDFQLSPITAWNIETQNGGEVSWGGSASPAGFPSSGYAGLRCSDAAGSGAEMVRRGSAMVLDATKPIEVETWLTVRGNSAEVADDECQWLFGVKSADGEQAVALYAYLDSGDRVYALATIIDDAPTGIEPATFPGDLGEYLRVRIRVTPTGSTLEVGVEDGEYDVLATSTTAPTACVYFPVLSLSRDSGTGDRSLIVDRVRGSAARSVALAGGAPDESSEIVPPITDHGDLDGLADDDHPQYLAKSGGAMTGGLAMGSNPITTSSTVDGRDLSTDGSKLDGIEAGADQCNNTNVRTALAAGGGDIDVAGVRITNMSGPAANADAATKQYVDLITRLQYQADPGTSHVVSDGDHNFVFGATNGSSSLTVEVPHTVAPGTRVTFSQRAIGFPILLTASGGMTLNIPQHRLPRTVDALYATVTITVLDSGNGLVEGDLAGQAERVVTPASFSTQQDDFDPGDGDADVIRIENTAGAAVDFTGLDLGASQVDGREVLLINVSTGNNGVILTEEDTDSVVTNRFSTPAGNSIFLYARGSVRLRYDGAIGSGTPGRWLIVSESRAD